MISAVFLASNHKFWILDPLYAALGQMLAWFYGLIPSFGVAIILLTVAVSILRMPLVSKQVKSQQEMQRIQPELKRIQAKYKSDPQKRNEELMKLYREHNVNPFAGCLPLLLQMPLFIVLYRLILNLNAQPEPKHIPRDSALFEALVEAGGRIQSFGMDLAQAASKVNGVANMLPYLFLIALVILSGLYQQRQMTARLPKDGMNTQMQVMTKIFPVFLGFISFSIPAGVVLYFLISNVWQIGQQAVLFRHQPVTGPAGSAGTAPARKGGGGGGRGGAGRSGEPSPGPDAGAGDGGGGRAGGGGGGRAAAGGGFFARLARAPADRDGGAAAKGDGAGGERGPDGTAGRKAERERDKGGRGAAPTRGNRRGGPSGSAGGGGGGKGSGSRSPNGRVTPKGGGRGAGKGQSSKSRSRNSRRGK